MTVTSNNIAALNMRVSPVVKMTMIALRVIRATLPLKSVRPMVVETLTGLGDCEFCNVPTGECYDDDQPHCRTCSLNDLLYPVFGEECLLLNETGGIVLDLFFGTQSKKPDEVCYPIDPADPFNPNGTCYNSYAVMSCDINAEEACPRGFSCVQLTYTDGSTTDVCYGDCQYYRENGHL